MAACLWAQASGGALSGRVTDAAGAAVPNLRIELENTATGQRIQTISGTDGTYLFNDLPVGTYRVTMVRGTGSPASGQDVTVELGRTVAVNLTMPAGPSTDPLVTAQNVPVETSTANILRNYNTRFIHYLPWPNLVARDGSAFGAYNLGLLSEGLTSGAIGQRERGPAVGGTRPINNNFHVDGIDNNNKAVPGPLVYVSNEATTEFALFHNQPNPMFGHATGGNWNSLVRSGTNQAHGAIYNYLQNRHLNAIPSSLRRLGYDENPRYDQNRLGGSLGVPIVPSKFFVFGNFEYIPLGYSRPLAVNTYAPTAAGLTQLSQIQGISSTNLGILRDAVGQTGPATRFANVAGSSIPLGRVNSEVRGWQNQFNGTGAGDFTLTDKDQLHFRYVHNESEANNSGFGIPSFLVPQRMKSLLATASHYHTFGNAVTNELRFGFNRFAMYHDPSDFSFGGLSTFPNINVAEANLSLGPQFGFAERAAVNTYHLADGIAMRLGSHNLRIGADGRRYLGYTAGTMGGNRGLYNYSSLDRFLRDVSPDVAAQRAFGGDDFDLGQWLIHAHVQDMWQVTPNLSVDLGLRWQYATIPNALQRGMRANGRLDGVYELDETLAGWTNFAPQVGIAFSPGDSRLSVFRAGFGMHYDALYSSNYYGMTGFAPSYAGTVFGDLGTTTQNFLGDGGLLAPAQARPGFAASQDWADGQRLPYSMQWNASWQQAFWRNGSFEFKYLGSRGVNLPVVERLGGSDLGVSAARNLPLYLSAPTQAQLNALPNTLDQLRAGTGSVDPLNTINWGGNSWYHAGTFNLTHRFTGGFQFLGNYTLSRFEDDSTGSLMDIGTPRTRYWSLYDRRHRATATAMFELGALLRNTPVAAFFADFNMNGIFSYESPGRLPVMSGSDLGLNYNALGAGSFHNAAGQAGVGSGVSPLVNGQGQTVAYLANNPNAQYFAGGPGMFSGQRNYLRTNETRNFDVSAAKRFLVAERVAFEVRGEAYNVFNRSQFTGTSINSLGSRWSGSVPGYLTPGNPEFNNLEANFANNARILQVALRLTF